MMNDPFVHEQAEALRLAPNRSGQIPTSVFARWCSFVLVDHLHLKSKPFWSHSTPPTSLTSCSTPKPSCTGTSAMTHCGKFRTGPITRRDMLARGAAGFAGRDSAHAAVREHVRAKHQGITGSDGLGLKHHAAKARSVIFLYMDGGPGQMDTFDPKPELKKWAGQPFPGERSATQFEDVGGVLPSPWSFKQYGECGHTISSLFPHLPPKPTSCAWCVP